MRQIFSIGKVIQIRTDPCTVKRLAFVETEEHIRHVVEMLNWLYPEASETVRRATKLHDIGKKIYLQRPSAFNRQRGYNPLNYENLINDFYQQGNVRGEFTATDAMKRYLAFLEQGENIKCHPIRQNPQEDNSPIVSARYRLTPPFGPHAASVQREDLQGIPDTDLDYIHSLIQLHHNFQVDKLVPTAAQHGEGIIEDLYHLMTADGEGSRWAEYLVQKLECGEEEPQGKFGFSEFAIEPTTEPTEISRNGCHVRGQVILKAMRRPDLGKLELTVDYYITDCDLNPDKYLSKKKRGGRRK